MSFEITRTIGGERRTYVGLGPSIKVVDIDHAIEALQMAGAGYAGAPRAVAEAMAALAYAFDYKTPCDCDDDDDFDYRGNPDCDEESLGLALARACSGDLQDACIHLARGLEAYPDAVGALDLIRAGLRP